MPKEPKFFSGHGASEEDLARGYLRPKDEWKPEQDLENYKPWYTQDKREDLDFPASPVGSGAITAPSKLQQKWEFQDKHRQSEGFLTRNHRKDY